ncbi:hypothetical protein [Leuconostoc litchii]|uniref:LPXTG cell wall anchor domain-containing protein n=1 Tax=Leuconostoc litchii TaxID=1981069 RepID=A0A6P2CQQ3_9LACO|nr:hypothetical protein [Leuconostoc litchii]TYC46667.1 hypothetical protein ESZ47_00585 [Leuconostoc litchii]
MNSDSYVTISFSNDMGIPVDKHNEDEYYVLGPKNNTSKSNIFIGVNGHQEKKSILPDTGSASGFDGLLFIIFNIIILMVFLYTLRQSDFETD